MLVALSVAPAFAAGAQAPPPTPAPSVDTILPPADEDDVVIVPTDERPDEPPDGTGNSRSEAPDGFDLGDVDPAEAGGWSLLVLVSVVATAVATARLARTLHVWRSPAAVRASGFRAVAEPATTFSLLVPAAPGESGLGQTLDRLAALDHPAVEVLAVVGRGDADNRGAALAAAVRSCHRVRLVLVDEHVGRRRAAALNLAFAEARGQVVGVFRPGDEVDRLLLRHVEGCFTNDGADAVQGGILLVPARRPHWFTVRQVVDRYFWYRSRLQFHAQQRFMPLDETTVFFRAEVLRAAGGWHRLSVAPECDLGVRLSVNGARVLARYDPDLATRAATAGTVRALLRDETRRVRGQLQVLGSGVWRRLPTPRQRLLARWTLVRPCVEQLTGLATTAAAVGAVVAGAPVAMALLALAPLVPGVVTLGVEQAALVDLREQHGQRVLVRDRALLLVSALPYQMLQAVAALWALVTEVRPLGRRRRPGMPVAPSTARRRGPGTPLDPLGSFGASPSRNGQANGQGPNAPPSVVDSSATSTTAEVDSSATSAMAEVDLSVVDRDRVPAEPGLP